MLLMIDEINILRCASDDKIDSLRIPRKNDIFIQVSTRNKSIDILVIMILISEC